MFFFSSVFTAVFNCFKSDSRVRMSSLMRSISRVLGIEASDQSALARGDKGRIRAKIVNYKKITIED